ncbi:MAG: 4Fe-4S binding protein [Bacteroidales bacterium]|nr:4Fe-4S binding protein [Bacteroidales bacterium]
MSNHQENSYFGGLFSGIKSLAIGLYTTMRELFVKKITQEYPENRAELKMFDRFRGSLIMPHNENNEHKCISCHLCEKACPNDTIKVIDEVIEVDGKKKKILGVYEYNLGKCMFCMLCTQACPQDAIEFDQSFENAVFDRNVLNMRLNAEGSKCVERKPAPKPAPAKPVTAQSETTATPAPATATANEVKSESPTPEPVVTPKSETSADKEN